MASRTYWRVWAPVLGIFLSAHGLWADVVTVTAVGSGNWGNPNTWSPAVVPNNGGGTTYAVGITQQSPHTSTNVEADISPTVNSVTLTGGLAPIEQAVANLEVLSNSTLTAGTVGATGTSLITVDSGGALSANTVALNDLGAVRINGTATISSVSAGPLIVGETSSFGVGSGGAANVGSIDGGQVFVGGTLNLSGGAGIDSFMSVGGTLTVGTGNLLPLNSLNTLVNNGGIGVANQVGASLSVGGPAGCSGCFSLFSDATYDEVIDSATGAGGLVAPAIGLDDTLEITLANSYIPPVGQRFVIMSGSNPSSTLSGTFANIEGQTFNNGTEMWDVQYTQGIFGVAPPEVILTAEPNVVPEPSLVALTGLGLAGIVALSRSRLRSVPNAPA